MAPGSPGPNIHRNLFGNKLFEFNAETMTIGKMNQLDFFLGSIGLTGLFVIGVICLFVTIMLLRYCQQKMVAFVFDFIKISFVILIWVVIKWLLIDGFSFTYVLEKIWDLFCWIVQEIVRSKILGQDASFSSQQQQRSSSSSSSFYNNPYQNQNDIYQQQQYNNNNNNYGNVNPYRN